MLQSRPCPACGSPYSIFLQDVLGNRTKSKIPQFICLDCHSLNNKSGYRESDEQKRFDAEYLIKRADHIRRQQGQLVLEIIDRLPGLKKVCEVGCGAGFFLNACHDFGLSAVGFDVNSHAIAYARDVLGVDARNELLTTDHTERYDLLAAIGVFEHLEEPREVFALMRSKLNKDGCIYLNVPFFERNHWRFMDTASDNPGNFPDPFYDNDVHIVHFSIEGMMRMGRDYGARRADYFVSKDVVDNSPGAYPGVLFQF
jgi:SAM-dependent methyltransferase